MDFQVRIEKFANDTFENHLDIYNKVNSWIEESKIARRENLQSFIFSSDFKVDKLLLFNGDKNKLIGTINLRKSNRKAARNDWVFMFWGVKINDVWYFTKGGNLFVPRENYKYNINE